MKKNIYFIVLASCLTLTILPAAHSDETTLLLRKIQTKPFTTKEFSHVKGLISRGADINATDENGDTVLMLAIKSKLLQTVIDFILRSGANVHTQNSGGNTALHLAVISNNEELVRSLMEKGANTATVNSKGLTPIRVAEMKIERGEGAYQTILDLLQGKTPAAAAPTPGLGERITNTAGQAWETASEYASSAAKWAGSWIPGRRSTSPQEERPMAFTQTKEGSDEQGFEIIEPEEK